MQKLPLYLLSLLSLGLAGFAFWQHGQISDQALQISALGKTIAARDTYVREAQQAAEKLEKQNRAFVEESAALRKKIETKASASPTPMASATPPPAAAKTGSLSGMMDKMMQNPKMLDAIAAQQMAVLKPMYADLLKQLNLSPEESEQFYKLLSAQASQAMEAGMKMMSGDKKAADDLKAFGSSDDMKALLGDRYSQYENYQKSIPDRAQLTQINSQMAARNTPLRADQSNGLFQIMSQEKLNTARFASATSNPNNTNFDDKTISDTISAAEDRNARILARSKTLLTTDQWNALAEQQNQTLQMQKMGMEMAKGMFSPPSK